MKSGFENVLIVGINSFLGKKLAEILCETYYVIGIFHKNVDEDIKQYELFQVEEIDKIKYEFRYVFIVSAYIPYSFNININEKLYKANVSLIGTVSRHFNNSKIIFCSTVSVYEDIKDGFTLNEESKVLFNSEYAISKYWGEQIVKKNDKYAIVRLSSIYGEGMKNHTYIPKIIEKAILENKIEIYGEGSRMQNYIHVSDAAQILINAAKDDGNNIYLGVSPNSYSNLQIAEIIADFTESKIIFKGEDKSVSYRYNSIKTMQLLSEEYKFMNIKNGIKNLIEWKKRQY